MSQVVGGDLACPEETYGAGDPGPQSWVVSGVGVPGTQVGQDGASTRNRSISDAF